MCCHPDTNTPPSSRHWLRPACLNSHLEIWLLTVINPPKVLIKTSTNELPLVGLTTIRGSHLLAGAGRLNSATLTLFTSHFLLHLLKSTALSLFSIDEVIRYSYQLQQGSTYQGKSLSRYFFGRRRGEGDPAASFCRMPTLSVSRLSSCSNLQGSGIRYQCSPWTFR